MMMQNHDNELRRKALIDQLGSEPLGGAVSAPPMQPSAGDSFNPAQQSDNTGITGGAPAAPPPGQLGAFANKLEGFDATKLNSEHNSPKYAFGRVMSQFDPKGGISQEMLDALNGLGMGTVSGKIGGDKISIGGELDPRFEGVTEFDIIRDLENGGGFQWNGLNGSAAQAAPQAGPMGGGMVPMGGVPLDALIGGDPLAKIQAAIAQFSGQRPNMEALLQQLGQ